MSSPQIDLVDDTWIDVSPGRVAALVADPANWQRWWPHTHVQISQDRAELGMQWTVHRCELDARHPTSGSQEIWLEPVSGGVVLHFFLRLDPLGSQLSSRRARRLQRRHAWQTKANFWAVKDELESTGELSADLTVSSTAHIAVDPCASTASNVAP